MISLIRNCPARQRFLLPSASSCFSQTGRKIWQKSSTLPKYCPFLCLFRFGLCQFLPLFHLDSTIERVNFDKSRGESRQNAFQIDPAFMDGDIAKPVFLVRFPDAITVVIGCHSMTPCAATRAGACNTNELGFGYGM
jgi:hypothetical protein